MKRIIANFRYTELLPGDEFTCYGVRYRVVSNYPERWELVADQMDGGGQVIIEYN